MSDTNLYFIQRSDGLIKIGISRNVSQRLRTLARVHGALNILKVVQGGRNEEADLHNELRHWRQFGEWFKPVSEVLSAIETVSDADPSPDNPRADSVDDDLEKPFVDRANRYIKACIDARRSRLGDERKVAAIQSIAEEYGLSYNTLRHISDKKAKTVTAGVLDCLRQAALTEMETTVHFLREELAAEERSAS